MQRLQNRRRRPRERCTAVDIPAAIEVGGLGEIAAGAIAVAGDGINQALATQHAARREGPPTDDVPPTAQPEGERTMADAASDDVPF